MLGPKLHRIRIEKFRRIRDVLELDLRTPRGRPSPLAVLAGPNGCGKTSVLEAVLLGLGQEDARRARPRIRPKPRRTRGAPRSRRGRGSS